MDWQVSVFDPVADRIGLPGDGARDRGGRAARHRARRQPVRRGGHAGHLGRGGGRATAQARPRVVRGADRVAHAGRRAPVLAAPTRGCLQERIAALRAPAGMDIGAETPEEVAVSILAELTMVRRGRAPFVAMPGPATLAGQPASEPAELEPVLDDIVLVDPVCGMTVERDRARHLAEHDGVVYAFCRMGCRTAFIREPEVYLAARCAARPDAITALGGPDAVQGHGPDRRPARPRVDLPDGPEPGRVVRTWRRVDRGHRRRPLQGKGQGRRRVHLREVRGGDDDRDPRGARSRGPQGPRPGARDRRSTRLRTCACRDPRMVRRPWTGRRTWRSRARWPRSGRG